MNTAQHTPGRRLHDMWVNASLCTGSIYHWDDLSDAMRERWECLAESIVSNRRDALNALPEMSIDQINALPSAKGPVLMSMNDRIVRIAREAYRAAIAKAAGSAG